LARAGILVLLHPNWKRKEFRASPYRLIKGRRAKEDENCQLSMKVSQATLRDANLIEEWGMHPQLCYFSYLVGV
jgi:hypothetical protein